MPRNKDDRIMPQDPNKRLPKDFFNPETRKQLTFLNMVLKNSAPQDNVNNKSLVESENKESKFKYLLDEITSIKNTYLAPYTRKPYIEKINKLLEDYNIPTPKLTENSIEDKRVAGRYYSSENLINEVPLTNADATLQNINRVILTPFVNYTSQKENLYSQKGNEYNPNLRTRNLPGYTYAHETGHYLQDIFNEREYINNYQFQESQADSIATGLLEKAYGNMTGNDEYEKVASRFLLGALNKLHKYPSRNLLDYTNSIKFPNVLQNLLFQTQKDKTQTR